MINTFFFYQISAYAIHGKILKNSYEKNKFKISALALDESFELRDGSYSILDIQNNFEYIRLIGKRLIIFQ